MIANLIILADTTVFKTKKHPNELT